MSFGSPYFTLPKFRYLRPKTLNEAIEILSSYGDDARVMAGGIGLLNFMKERLVEPKVVVDLKGIPELRRLEYNGYLHVGATVTMNELLGFSQLKKEYRGLYEAISVLSDHNLRNRSTIVGDMCEALPWVDSPPPLIAYDASVMIKGKGGERKVMVRDFIKGMAQVDLSNDEIVTAIEVPEAKKKEGRFYKFSRGSEFAIASLAIVYDRSKSSLKMVFGAVSETPFYPEELSETFSRSQSSEEFLNRSISYLRRNFTPMEDSLASSSYRLNVMEKLMVQGLKDVLQKGVGESA
ncbi:MAG: xanthine dehydrogenase family protein subunit M [Conexivisphaerales archaeon]